MFICKNNNIINKIESIPEANRSILTDVRTELANSINELISNSMSSAIEEIKLNAGGASGISSQKLDEFKDECNKIFAGFKAEIPGIIESVKLDDKLEVIQSRIISTVSDEINKSFASDFGIKSFYKFGVLSSDTPITFSRLTCSAKMTA